MDFKKYLTRLGVEPRSQDPRFLDASRSSLDHARAHAEAQKFEDKLEAALKLPSDPALKQDLLAIAGGQSRPASHASVAGWLALAASVLVLVGVASFLLPTTGADAQVRQAFVAHLSHPEPALTARQNISDQRILERFAERGIVLREGLQDVSYYSPCVIGDVPGLHLVMTDDEHQQVTLMLMPGQGLESKHNFSMGDMTVQLSETSAGALALFGHQGQDLSGTMRDLLRNIDGPRRSLAAH